MSTSLMLGVVGAGIGSFFGAPGLGFTLGSMIGSAFDGGGASQDLPDYEGSRMEDLRVQGSAYGSAIPIHFGRNRIAGQIIWAPPIVEHVTTQEVGGGDAGGKGGAPDPPTQTQTTYTYSASFAILLCRGQLSGFGRIWLDGKLFYDARGGSLQGLYAGSSQTVSIAFYPGNDTQMPDPTIEAHLGAGNVPAYRGRAYIVFKDLQIDDFGRRIPNVTVEVFRNGSAQIGKAFPVVTGDYNWGDIATNYVNVFTVNQNGVLRILNQQDGTVRLLDLNGHFIGFAGRDKSLDAYGSSKAHDCGRLNGYNLWFEGDVQYPFNGQHPTNGNGSAPKIYPYPNGTVLSNLESLRLNNLLDVVEDKTEYLMGFAVAGDQRRAMIVTARDIPSSSSYQPSKWYLIYINDEAPVVETSGSAVGFPVSVPSGLGIGNRAGLGGIIGTFVYSFHAATLENDYKHFWHAYGAGTHDIECFRVEAGGVTPVYKVSQLFAGSFIHPTLIAEHGMCWVAGYQQICPVTRLQVNLAVDPPLSQVVSEICQLSNLTSADIDVSALTNNVMGYTISRQTSIRASLQQLMTAYFFDAVESDSKIKFRPRGISSVATITSDQLAAHAEGNQLPDLITLRRQQDLELPKRVNVTYINTGADYQVGYQYAARIDVDSVNEQTIELPIVLTDDQAAKIADTVLYGVWLARETHQCAIGIEFIYLEPCDVVTLQTDTATFISRITSVELGEPGIILLHCSADDAAVYQSRAMGGTIQLNEQTIAPAGPTDLRLLDIPIVRALDNDPGFYMAASGYFDNWRGASILQSNDQAAWNPIKVFVTPSIIGVANNALGDGLTTIPDLKNTLNVRLVKGQLASITDTQLLAGGNLAVLGNELLQFRDAILQADGTYTLSYFLRGRFGTEWAVNTHTPFDEFTLLTERTIQRVLLDENTIGSKRYYKAVTIGSTFDSTISKTFTNKAIGLKPYAPVHLRGVRDGSSNLTISWIRRTRYGGEWRDSVDVPLAEAAEQYEIEILNSANTVVRTLTSTTQIASYTAAQQTTDGFAAFAPIRIRVYQLSATVGRGIPAEAVI